MEVIAEEEATIRPAFAWYKYNAFLISDFNSIIYSNDKKGKKGRIAF